MQRGKLAERGKGRGAAPPPQAVKAGFACFVPAEPERAAPGFAPSANAAEGQGGAAAGQGSGLRRAGAGGRCVVGLAAGRCKGRGGPQAGPGAAGAGGLRPPKPSSGRFGLRPPANLPPAKNPPTAVGGFRYLFRDYSSAGVSSSTGSSSGASSASSALMDRLAR